MTISEKVEIGLTTQRLLENKKYYSKLEDFQTRKNNLISFISSFTDLKRVNIVEIKDWSDMNKYAQDIEYEGLIVSQETYENAIKLNDNREKNGLNPIILIVIPIIKNEKNEKISSTVIRENL